LPEIIESRENYLEIIYLLNKKGAVRSIDIVEMSGYSKPSVSNAVHSLETQGYLVIDENRHIQLTGEGKKIAVEVYKRHKCITGFFMKTLDIDEKTAEENACKIEHCITPEFYDAIKKFFKDRAEERRN